VKLSVSVFPGALQGLRMVGRRRKNPEGRADDRDPIGWRQRLSSLGSLAQTPALFCGSVGQGNDLFGHVVAFQPQVGLMTREQGAIEAGVENVSFMWK
jgi:hypothetical protein